MVVRVSWVEVRWAGGRSVPEGLEASLSEEVPLLDPVELLRTALACFSERRRFFSSCSLRFLTV